MKMRVPSREGGTAPSPDRQGGKPKLTGDTPHTRTSPGVRPRFAVRPGRSRSRFCLAPWLVIALGTNVETGTALAAKEDEEQKLGQPQSSERGGFLKSLGGAGSGDGDKASSDAAEAPSSEAAKSGKAKPERRARLLERITGSEKPSA